MESDRGRREGRRRVFLSSRSFLIGCANVARPDVSVALVRRRRLCRRWPPLHAAKFRGHWPNRVASRLGEARTRRFSGFFPDLVKESLGPPIAGLDSLAVLRERDD